MTGRASPPSARRSSTTYLAAALKAPRITESAARLATTPVSWLDSTRSNLGAVLDREVPPEQVSCSVVNFLALGGGRSSTASWMRSLLNQSTQFRVSTRRGRHGAGALGSDRFGLVEPDQGLGQGVS